MVQELNSYNQKPVSGGVPKQLVVLLHGYGSNGRDLISLAPYWQDAIPDAIFVSPDAPFPCEMAPASSGGFQWFSLLDRDPAKMLAGAKSAQTVLGIFLDEQLAKYNLSNAELALVGFSQGTMTSLYAGPRRVEKIAGILGYSGALIGGEELGDKSIQKCPIRMIHGEADSVVPVNAYHESRRVLEAKGFDVSGFTTTGLEHSIDGEGVESGAEFLSKIFN